jgi:hypothetical protein
VACVGIAYLAGQNGYIDVTTRDAGDQRLARGLDPIDLDMGIVVAPCGEGGVQITG